MIFSAARPLPVHFLKRKRRGWRSRPCACLWSRRQEARGSVAHHGRPVDLRQSPCQGRHWHCRHRLRHDRQASLRSGRANRSGPSCRWPARIRRPPRLSDPSIRRERSVAPGPGGLSCRWPVAMGQNHFMRQGDARQLGCRPTNVVQLVFSTELLAAPEQCIAPKGLPPASCEGGHQHGLDGVHAVFRLGEHNRCIGL